MRSYKDFVIMTDMDGTLIGSNHEVSEKNKEAIKYFVEQGGRFGVATGRTQNNCINYMEGLTINAPCIFYNGGALFDWQKKEFIKTCQLDHSILLKFIKECMENCPKLCIQIYTNEKIFVISSEENHDQVMMNEKQEFVSTNLEEVKKLSWVKLLLCDDMENLLKCQQISQHYSLDKTTNHFFSSPYYLEFVEKNVSKGHMLSELKTLPDYQNKIFIAAGDFDNDIEMLKRADCGIAPANAQPLVKEVADLIGVSHDEHLLDYIIYKVIPKMF